ncbi:16S rRNA (guanine(966)-N(2))-methyltransferase RsmD [Halotalea alkalilenta]|uniref:16S rRNA (guanine(966)-N(2))-methyltransferase RsmD n=1 Tax=Halotalea alkalilenta TaxID=376489 RepID=UPI001B809535|nr:16S rRNA (guanine(966)-N(2))-methyltransferase RsmD [Halotalea alkalilenta]
MSPKRPPSHHRTRPAGRVRLIGGRLKRSVIEVLHSPGLRPTPDRVRETLFNWLAFELAGVRVLDPFAGSGALGFEAISRGAAKVLMIERDRRVAGLLRDNARRLGIGEQVEVREADALAQLARTPDEPYDLVFLDPPFHQGLAAEAAALLERHGWLTQRALIYLECESSLATPVPANWEALRDTRAGETQARLYRRAPTG